MHHTDLDLNIAKCNLFRMSVDYFSHVVVFVRLNSERRNTMDIRNFYLSTSQTRFCCFLGMCNVYCFFFLRFTVVTEPLNQLLTKGMAAQLAVATKAKQRSFDSPLEALVVSLVHQLTYERKQFSIKRKALRHQIRCSLMQAQTTESCFP